MNKVLSIPTLFAAVLLLVSAQFIFASNWTNPPANPPDGNTATPINVGPSNQVKEGDISADDFISLGTSPSIVFKNSNAGTDRFSNWIQFTGSTGALAFKNDSNENGNFWEAGVDKYGMMIFEDHVRAAKYCDLNGENCLGGNSAGTYSTMIPGWPDAIRCKLTHREVILTPDNYSGGTQSGVIYYQAAGVTNAFNANGSPANPSNAGDCAGKSIDQLAKEGKAFSFNVSVFQPSEQKVDQFVWEVGAWEVVTANTCTYGDNSVLQRDVFCLNATDGTRVSLSSCSASTKPITRVSGGSCNNEGGN